MGVRCAEKAVISANLRIQGGFDRKNRIYAYRKWDLRSHVRSLNVSLLIDKALCFSPPFSHSFVEVHSSYNCFQIQSRACIPCFGEPSDQSHLVGIFLKNSNACNILCMQIIHHMVMGSWRQAAGGMHEDLHLGESARRRQRRYQTCAELAHLLCTSRVVHRNICIFWKCAGVQFHAQYYSPQQS